MFKKVVVIGVERYDVHREPLLIMPNKYIRFKKSLILVLNEYLLLIDIQVIAINAK